MTAATLPDAPSKEEVYDVLIYPLMARILETCKTHGISMVASFAIPSREDEALRATSVLLPANDKRPPGENLDDLDAAQQMLLQGFVAYTRRVRT